MVSSWTALSAVAVVAATVANAQLDPAVTKPLAEKRFDYPGQIPYKVDTDEGTRRGPQLGFNQCNSTTESQTSLCQTSFVNSADDFCLWAPSKPNSLIADTEGEEVAWCTKPGRGTRVIPAGALQGVQFMKTSAYVQVVGFIDQSFINIQGDDSGGELDPHGADLRGNPLGGLMYSNAFGDDKSAFKQVIEWHNFMGGNQFCIKVCDPNNKDGANFCQHIYDRIGCAYNAPNAAKNGTFESCEGETQDFPGVYTSAGQVMTYSQPPESLGAIQTMPYQPRVPASSNCAALTSSVIYAAAATAVPSASRPAAAAPSGSAAASGAGSPHASGVTGTRASSAPGVTGSARSDTAATGAAAGRAGPAVVVIAAGVVAGALALL